MLESSADGIFILDPRMRFVGFNRACARLTGYTADKAIGQEHAQVIRWLRREPGLGLEEAVAGGWPLSAQATLYVEGDLLRHGGEPLSVGITYAARKPGSTSVTADEILRDAELAMVRAR